MRLLVLAVSGVLLGACSLWPLGQGIQSEAGSSSASAEKFLADFDRDVRPLRKESAAAGWVQATYISEDTQHLAARAAERLLGYFGEQARAARAFDPAPLDAASARQLHLLKMAGDVPANAAELAEYTRLAAKLEAMYGTGEYCPEGDGAPCLDLGELEKLIASSEDPDELLRAWQGWRTISPPMRPLYRRFAELKNIGAREIGFADAGALLRGGYDMPAEAFTEVVERLWDQVQPLYQALHCHVRAELGKRYGDQVVDPTGPIPAHLLGNMWGQTWEQLYPRLVPFPEQGALDVSSALQAQEYDATRMIKQAEDFYIGLGLPALPASFFQRSLFEKPADREVVCHASAWSVDLESDVRIKMCIEPDEDNLLTIYHELGHVYYYLAYQSQPYIFQSGAHDGFHEAVGDTLMLSMTPEYLHSVGLAAAPNTSAKALVNQQFKMALSKLAFLPFGLLVDKWRWQVLAGEVPEEKYNEAWWDLRRAYQGVAAPVARPPEAFDPGAKYHIPGDTPYTRYFLAHIMQFQFYQALCEASGHKGALHDCNFSGSTAAGQRLWEMLKLGQSRPWQDALEAITGTREMSADALLTYFDPLREWLEQENQSRSCGW